MSKGSGICLEAFVLDMSKALIVYQNGQVDKFDLSRQRMESPVREAKSGDKFEFAAQVQVGPKHGIVLGQADSTAVHFLDYNGLHNGLELLDLDGKPGK